MIALRLPSFGADMERAEFVQWQVRPGEAVKRGDIVAVVETEKGAIDVEAWQDGTIARLVAQPGQRLAVGQLMAVLADAGEDWQALARAPLPDDVVPAQLPAPVPAAPSEAAAPEPPAAPAAGASQALRISPAARRRASELGVDLAALADAHPERPLTLADVEAAAAAPATRAGGMRAAIGAAMERSMREIPHYHLASEIDVEAALVWLERANAARPIAGRVLFAALALRAIALALRETPALNGRCIAGRFEPATAIHLGVVTALRGGGLVVPTVHDADRVSLDELMRALREGLARARGGQLRSSDLADSTTSVTNLGDLGCDRVHGLIYPPQVALVGLGSVAPRPVVRDGAVVAARTVHVTLAGDHRVSDGLVGARFLAALRRLLAEPERCA